MNEDWTAEDFLLIERYKQIKKNNLGEIMSEESKESGQPGGAARRDMRESIYKQSSTVAGGIDSHPLKKQKE